MDSDGKVESGESQPQKKKTLPPQPMEFNVQFLRELRSGFLMVHFLDGYAPGWKMAVPEAFKEALDIKYTPRTVTIGKDEKGDAITRDEFLWTQGREFGFKQGDTIWDSKSIYPTWEEQLQHTTLGVQVVSASQPKFEDIEQVATLPGNLSVQHRRLNKDTGSLSNPKKPKEIVSLTINRSRWNPGTVRFKVIRPNTDRTKVEKGEEYVTTQDEFITFLQTGLVWQLKGGRPIDLFNTPAPKPVGPTEEPLL